MSCRLDDADRGILEFRPEIQFVEPDAEPATPNPVPVPVERLQLEDVEAERERIKKIAKAVNALAVATQARLDERAKDMKIKLDLNADQDVIQAMRRRYPNDDPTEITYQQYRNCRNNIRNKGVEIAGQATTTPDLVAAARDAALAAGPNAGTQLGGYGTEEAATGQLRPELNTRATIIPPLNVEEFQIDMICILVNFIWKIFIKPIFKPIAIPPPFGPSLADLLPDQLCDPGIKMTIPGLFILGDKPDDLLKGVVAQQASQVIAQGVNVE